MSPNGRNAGRLFSDCENEYGYGEWHSFRTEAELGDRIECTNCHREFIKTSDGIEPVTDNPKPKGAHPSG